MKALLVILSVLCLSLAFVGESGRSWAWKAHAANIAHLKEMPIVELSTYNSIRFNSTFQRDRALKIWHSVIILSLVSGAFSVVGVVCTFVKKAPNKKKECRER